MIKKYKNKKNSKLKYKINKRNKKKNKTIKHKECLINNISKIYSDPKEIQLKCKKKK